MSNIKTSPFHKSVGGHPVLNAGRLNGGEHKEHMIDYVEDMPRRGDFGPGKTVKPHNGATGKTQG